MAEETRMEETVSEETTTAAPAVEAVAADTEMPRASERRAMPRRGGDRRPGGRGGDRGGRRGGRDDRARSEFAQKMISIRRVARVMAGGRRFNFSVCMVIGDKSGRVGVGLGKAADTQLAIEKATRAAKRHMITIPLTQNRSIGHNVHAKYCASVIEVRPSPGRGLVAGSSVRTVLELAGVTDVTGKLLSRSKNPINNARAAIEALKSVSPQKGSVSGGQK